MSFLKMNSDYSTYWFLYYPPIRSSKHSCLLLFWKEKFPCKLESRHPLLKAGKIQLKVLFLRMHSMPQLPLRGFKGFYVPGNLEELLLFSGFFGTPNISLVRCLQMSIAPGSGGLE